MITKSARNWLFSIAAILVALGDLRNLLSSGGYWIAWCAWGAVTFLLSLKNAGQLPCRARIRATIPLYLSVPFLLLVIAFCISAAANSDVNTAYHGLKIFVVSYLGALIFTCSGQLTGEDIVGIVIKVMTCVFLVFVLSKYFIPDWYILLGDQRQGSVVAYPGVLWKTTAFFGPFIIANWFDRQKLSATNFFVLSFSIYLLIMDGSRTGFIWFLFSLFSLVLLRFVKSRGRVSPKIMVGLVVAIFVLTSLFYWLNDGENILWDVLAYDRLVDGDETRSEMLADGIRAAVECFPFGCGFSASVTQTTDGPMVIHNAYLSSLGDLGLIGFFALVGIVVSPFIPLFLQVGTRGQVVKNSSYFSFAAGLGVLGFAFSWMLHPLTTEMSEWGLLFIFFSWYRALSHCSVACSSRS